MCLIKHVNIIEFDENSELLSIGKNSLIFSAIEKITIPRKTSIICSNAFISCEKLEEVKFKN